MAWTTSCLLAMALALLLGLAAGSDFESGLTLRRDPYASNDGGILFARMHELWMAQHGRAYADEAERARRLEIFARNVRYIEDHNNNIHGDYNYTLRVNEFADLTSDEFAARYMGDRTPRDQALDLKPQPLDTLNLPSYVNWKDAGVVTPVKNQGPCGSCWAFGTVATIESAVAIKTGRLYSLSEQQLIDCDTSQLGCDGGWKDKAFRYVVNNGDLATDASYPYRAAKGSCLARRSAATISSYVSVSPNAESGELMAAVARQPVAVSIHPPRSWQFYAGDVFSGPCGDGGHTVAVVGYGRTGSTEYWLVKNSWGTSWGDAGYVRIRKGTNVCGIADRAYYPIY